VSANEIRLHDRIAMLQKQISKLERREHQTIKYIREMTTNLKPVTIDKDTEAIHDIIQNVSELINMAGKQAPQKETQPPPVVTPPPPPPPVMAPPPPPPMMPRLNIGTGLGPPPPPIMTSTTPRIQMKCKATKPLRNIFWDTIMPRDVPKSIFMKNGIAHRGTLSSIQA
jgi:hypothetical protein